MQQHSGQGGQHVGVYGCGVHSTPGVGRMDPDSDPFRCEEWLLPEPLEKHPGSIGSAGGTCSSSDVALRFCMFALRSPLRGRIMFLIII